MDFGNLREMSVKIVNYKKFRMLQENAWYIPSAVVIMTTADGMHQAFSRRHPILFFNFRSLPSRHGNCRSECRHRTKFFEVHYTPFTVIWGANSVFLDKLFSIYLYSYIVFKLCRKRLKVFSADSHMYQTLQALIRCLAEEPAFLFLNKPGYPRWRHIK